MLTVVQLFRCLIISSTLKISFSSLRKYQIFNGTCFETKYSSTVVGDIEIENNIGNALVQRIVRAHREGTKWKACILIPLLPGFTFPVDHDSASAVRVVADTLTGAGLRLF